MSEKSSESDMEFDNTPPEIINYAINISENLLPQKSKSEYEKYYVLFKYWKQERKLTPSPKNILIAFFG